MPMAYQMNLLLAALIGGPPELLPPAPRGPCGADALLGESRTMRYAVPSATTRTSSSTATVSEPRVLFTTSSLGLKTVTCPIVGRSVLGRIVAEATCSAKAFELAVEKVAEPSVRIAAGVASSVANVALLAPERSRRAAPART